MTTASDDKAILTPAAGRENSKLAGWDPEDPVFWRTTGAQVARRNLVFSVFSEHIGFSVWSLWAVFVLFLTPAYGISPEPRTAAAEKFLLTTLPTVAGAVLRIPYTLAVARFGGRNWTCVSAAVLLAPTVVAAVVLAPGVSYDTLLLVALLGGVGGGNFASSMANINAFYPQRLKGRVLGLNAGGGNIGVAVVQLAGLAVLATAGRAHPRVLLGIYIPLIVVAALCAALFMDNLPGVRNPGHAMRDACRNAHTWIISALYIATFGSFIGFSFARVPTRSMPSASCSDMPHCREQYGQWVRTAAVGISTTLRRPRYPGPSASLLRRNASLSVAPSALCGGGNGLSRRPASGWQAA